MHEYKEEDIAAQSNTKHRLTRSKNRRPPQVRNQICQGTVDDLLFIQADLETIVCGPIEEGNNVAF